MNNYIKILLMFLPLILISCSEYKSKYDFRQGDDGLLYEFGSDKLYTGRIIDTIDVIIEYEVVDGKKHGEFITYYMNGNTEKHGYIENNSNEGEWKYYYENGKLESVGKFKNNNPEGLWVFYYENGSKKEEGKFIKGDRKGKWTSYDEEGEVIKETDFDSGRSLEKEVQNQNHT
jgi:antitoxin component YwqK of YwqJK toxin-antitoxin module